MFSRLRGKIQFRSPYRFKCIIILRHWVGAMLASGRWNWITPTIPILLSFRFDNDSSNGLFGKIRLKPIDVPATKTFRNTAVYCVVAVFKSQPYQIRAG